MYVDSATIKFIFVVWELPVAIKPVSAIRVHEEPQDVDVKYEYIY